MKITTKEFGLGATLITFTSKNDISISFTNLGARIVDWSVNGKSIVLGFDSAQEYIEKDSYPGASIGRTAGRIKNGLIELNGKNIQLNQNEFPQTLHGGEDGFDLKLWRFEIFDQEDRASVRFDLTSNDGENGYPGKLDVAVTHSFDEQGRWTIDYDAISDKDTVFNPTGHVYFNLNGEASLPVDNHYLKLAATHFVPLLDKTEIVRGDIVELRDTVLDFRAGRYLAETFASDMEQVQLVGGIDHPFLLDEVSLEKEQACLSLDDLRVSVYTDRPSIVLFTANFGDLGTIYHGKPQVHHGGITFETQIAPGSRQISELGDISLKAGEKFHSRTIYQLNQIN
ncbi:MAG: galactose-1-epimerase [Streptococcaceae bacterium]|jgi:aldose 1-epimerase|nr:galactose-1-epimerase [Streptococcaceae bacterium]